MSRYYANAATDSVTDKYGFSRLRARVQVILFTVFAGFISGCATPTKTDPAIPGIAYESIEARQQTLAGLTNWMARGRISLSTPEEGFSAAMAWVQAQRDYDVTLTALLGQRAFRVSQKGQTANLKTLGRKNVSGRDAEQLLLSELGVRVPLTQFGYWMRGLPGNLGRPTYDAAGRLQHLDYVDPDGVNWRASFKRYKVVESLELPELIDVTGQEYMIRILLKSWQWQSSLQADPAGTQPGGRLNIPNA